MAIRGEQVWKIEIDENSMRVDFITKADDKVRQSFYMKDIHENHRDRLALKGLKVGLEERTSAVPGSHIQEKMDARQEYADLWKTEKWSKDRIGGGFTVAVHLEAIARIQDCSVEAARKAFAALPEDSKAALKRSEKVKAVIAEIEAERAEVGDLDLTDLID